MISAFLMSILTAYLHGEIVSPKWKILPHECL